MQSAGQLWGVSPTSQTPLPLQPAGQSLRSQAAPAQFSSHTQLAEAPETTHSPLPEHCDGEPGQRIPDMFYGAYVRDPDGNKLAFFQFG